MVTIFYSMIENAQNKQMVEKKSKWFKKIKGIPKKKGRDWKTFNTEEKKWNRANNTNKITTWGKWAACRILKSKEKIYKKMLHYAYGKNVNAVKNDTGNKNRICTISDMDITNTKTRRRHIIQAKIHKITFFFSLKIKMINVSCLLDS